MIEAQLAVPPPPVEMLYLFNLYARLRRRLNGTGFGPSRLTYEALDAFCRFSQIRLAPWEVEVLEELDDKFLGVQATARAAEATKGGK